MSAPHLKTNTPSQNRGHVAILFLAHAPKMGVSFLPLSPLLFISLGPWSLGPRETVLTTETSLSSLPFCSLALESCCQTGRDGAVYLSLFSVLWAVAPHRGSRRALPPETVRSPKQHSLQLSGEFGR